MVVGKSAIILMVTFLFSSRCHSAKVAFHGVLENVVSKDLFGIPSDGLTPVSVIQEDLFDSGPGHLLMAMGGALVAASVEEGFSEVLIGAIVPNNGKNVVNDTRFSNISGIAQLRFGAAESLPFEQVIFSDENNRCLRKLDRFDMQVTTFAGECETTTNATAEELECSRIDGPLGNSTFCAPKTLHYDELNNRILVLDASVNDSAIRSIDLNTSTIQTLYEIDYTMPSFSYNEINNTASFAFQNGSILVVDLQGDSNDDLLELTNRSRCDTRIMSASRYYDNNLQPHDILELNGLYIVSHWLLTDTVFIDPTADLDMELCLTLTMLQIPCSLMNPYALAYLNGYLYIGDSVIFDKLARERTLRVYRIRMSVAEEFSINPNCDEICCEDEWLAVYHDTSTPGDITFPTGGFPTFPYWSPDVPIIPDIPTPNFNNFDDDDDYSGNYYYSGFGGVVIVVPCFYVYRRRRRTVLMRNATVVSVRSSVPHQRLIETGGPEEGPSPSYNGAEAMPMPSTKLPTYTEATEQTK